MSEVDVEKEEDRASFEGDIRKKRMFSYIICALNYSLVHFHRYCPSVLANKMAPDLGVPVSKLGIFASMYYWSYALMQPIVGCTSDFVDAGVILGCSGLLSALGTLVCGLSSNFYLSSVARFLVGIGCSCPFVAISKFMANWFEPRQYYIMNSILFSLGGIGGILSQRPLIALSNVIGWRWSYTMIAIIGSVFSVLALIFVSSSPVAEENNHLSLSATLLIMVKNLRAVCSIAAFWVHSVSVFFATSAYQNLSGMWAVPFMMDTYGFSNDRAGTVSLSLQFVMIIGSPSLGFISVRTGMKKSLEVICYTLGTLICLVFFIYAEQLPEISLYFLFFFLGVFVNSTQSFTMPMYKDMVPPDMSATVVGCGNTFAFLGAAVMQSLTSVILGSFGSSPYSVEAYRASLWSLCLGACVVAVISSLLLPKSPLSQSDVQSDSEDADDLPEI